MNGKGECCEVKKTKIGMFWKFLYFTRVIILLDCKAVITKTFLYHIPLKYSREAMLPFATCHIMWDPQEICGSHYYTLCLDLIYII